MVYRQKRIDGDTGIPFPVRLTHIRLQALQQSREIILLLFLAIDLGILYHADYWRSIQITGMGITKSAYHPVGEQILGSSGYCFRNNRQIQSQIISQITVEQIGEVGIVIKYNTTVTGTLRPNTGI